jgi:hypothetical protein
MHGLFFIFEYNFAEMIKTKFFFFIIILMVFFSSCIIRAPRFTTLDKVFNLKVGMTKEEVSQTLNSKPYNLKLLTDTESVLLYKYRVTDRATVPFLLKENNGKSVHGKYANLVVTYGKNGQSTRIESCNNCDETAIEQKKIDINKVITFLTVTLPVVLVFLGIKFATTL